MKKIVFILLYVASLSTASGQTKSQPVESPLFYSRNMASAVMQTWKDSFALDGKPVKWTYDMGVILKGMQGLWENTGDGKYYNYIHSLSDLPG